MLIRNKIELEELRRHHRVPGSDWGHRIEAPPDYPAFFVAGCDGHGEFAYSWVTLKDFTDEGSREARDSGLYGAAGSDTDFYVGYVTSPDEDPPSQPVKALSKDISFAYALEAIKLTRKRFQEAVVACDLEAIAKERALLDQLFEGAYDQQKAFEAKLSEYQADD